MDFVFLRSLIGPEYDPRVLQTRTEHRSDLLKTTYQVDFIAAYCDIHTVSTDNYL